MGIVELRTVNKGLLGMEGIATVYCTRITSYWEIFSRALVHTRILFVCLYGETSFDDVKQAAPNEKQTSYEVHLSCAILVHPSLSVRFCGSWTT